MKQCVVVLSGGQDSTTCLYWALSHYEKVSAISFNYGQRHGREIVSAVRIARFAGVEHETLHLPGDVLHGTSPLVNPDSELEQYENPESLPGGLEKTFVPMRNQLFLTIAANRAYVLGCNHIVTGVSAEDFGGYPDCRPEFIDAVVRASSLGTFTGKDGAPDSLVIRTPLMNLTKKQTVERALLYADCYKALALTHTSYDGLYPPRGKDHATLLRQKGFSQAGIPDPLILRAYFEGLIEDLPDLPGYDETKSRFFMDANDVVSWLKKTEGEYYVP